MPVPYRWPDVLRAPSFVINLDSRPDRLATAMAAIRDAGFSNRHRFPGVDANNSIVLSAAWAACGSPRFADWDVKFRSTLGKQGCFLSHISLWQTILDQDLPFASVFEDDIFFHQHWSQLGRTYFGFTPRDYDLMYMGNEISGPGAGLIQRVPVYCTHAYVITREGAQKLRALLLGDPNGVATVDRMIFRHQYRHIESPSTCPFSWYVWNGEAFPDCNVMKYPEWRGRNTGLVFQNYELGSDVDASVL